MMASRDTVFRRAKWRLALSFAAVQLAFFAAFGVAVYAYVSTAFDVDALESDPSAITVEQAFATLKAGLEVGFGALVIIIPVTSYLLAALAIRPVRTSYEAQQRFVDDASHEFRTPLSAMQAQLELGLRRPRSVSDYRIILGRSLTATARLTAVLDDLLLLSRGQHGVTEMMHDIDVAMIVDDAIEQLAPGDAARIRRNDTADGVVTGVTSMLTRATLNLLTNALRYSGSTTEIRVEVSQHGTNMRISIVDHGQGMSRAQCRRAFDRFWRADPARDADGRGLGLSIVREIASIHRGRVDLVSQVNVGTRAVFELPLSR